MKNKWLLWVVPLLVLGVLLIVARLTGMLQMYRINSPSGEPNLKPGSIAFTSDLKKPIPGDIVAFKNEYVNELNPYLQPDKTYLQRMVADEGDIITMKDAVLYLNGKNFDFDKNLLHDYIADKNTVMALPNWEKLLEEDLLFSMSDSQFVIYLSTKEMVDLTKKGVILEKVLYNKGDSSRYTGSFAWMNKDSVWTSDNFGPITVPAGHFFVIGDFRHNSIDSRDVGFIKKENFRGTVLNK